MNTIKVETGSTKLIAHRGLSGLEAENTCAAFVAAGNRSYFGLETDVHRTGDGGFILIHDENTSRVAKDDVNVESTTFEALRQLRLLDHDGTKSRADLHLPSLEEYAGICKKYEKTCVLELKSDYTDEEIKEILNRIDALKWLDHVIFIAFGYDNLKKVRKYLPQQPCQFLTEGISSELVEQLSADNFDLDVYYPLLTEEWIHLLHRRGIKVNCWTVDDKAVAEKLVSWGIDFITTDILEEKP